MRRIEDGHFKRIGRLRGSSRESGSLYEKEIISKLWPTTDLERVSWGLESREAEETGLGANRPRSLKASEEEEVAGERLRSVLADAEKSCSVLFALLAAISELSCCFPLQVQAEWSSLVSPPQNSKGRVV